MTIQIGDGAANPAFTDVVSQGQTITTLNGAVSLQLRGQASAAFQITAIGSQTFTFEGSIDGTNFFAANAYPLTGGAAVTTTTTTGQWAVDCAGWFIVRLRCSTQTSGSATVSGIASQGGDVTQAIDAVGTARQNLVSWAGTALGTPTNFGTTPTAVIAGSVNASMFSGTTALGAPNTFGTTAPTGNALGVNAALFVGTTLARTNQATTAAGVVDVNVVGTLGATNSATNGEFARLTDNTTAITAAISALGTAPTGTSVQGVNSVALPNASAGAACTLFQNSAVTTAVVVKAGAGNIYGFMVNGGTSGNFLQFINASSAPTLGTAAVFSVQIPSTGIIFAPPASLAMVNNGTGISVGISTTYNGASAGTAAAVVVFYK
jgi:hypothetical protein